MKLSETKFKKVNGTSENETKWNEINEMNCDETIENGIKSDELE